MEQKNLEKLIWRFSSKTKIPEAPDKNRVWDNLVKKAEGLHDSPDLKTPFSFKGLINFSIPFPIKPSYLLILPIIFILALPAYFDFYQNKSFKTNPGENLSLLLPDNSKIILNSSSLLSYKNGFNEKHRTIYLEGEAYFDVKHTALPLIVRTKHGKVNVLGTSFNVKSRYEEFEVGVNSGSVTVSNNNSNLTLNPKECFKVKNEFSLNNIMKIDHNDYPGWLNKKLYCDQTSLEIICNEIERIHNVKIKFSNQDLKKITVTGVINTSELETMLKTIEVLSQHSFKLIGGSYTII